MATYDIVKYHLKGTGFGHLQRTLTGSQEFDLYKRMKEAAIDYFENPDNWDNMAAAQEAYIWGWFEENSMANLQEYNL